LNVLLSWSGDRSKGMASALNSWIPKVIQNANPWMSAEDISTGVRWNSELNTQLTSTDIGIICVTPENLQSVWLHFEAGSLSKSLSESKVMPLLLDLTPGQLSGPMSQFQAVQCLKEGVFKIIKSINESLGKNGLAEAALDEVFDVWWPKLEDKINSIAPPVEVIPKRDSTEMIEELLDIAREQRRTNEERLAKIDGKKEEVKALFDHMQNTMNEMDQRSKDGANLEKQKLAFLAKGQSNISAEQALANLPKELIALIDKQQGENPMKGMVNTLQNIQESFLRDIVEQEGDDKNKE